MSRGKRVCTRFPSTPAVSARVRFSVHWPPLFSLIFRLFLYAKNIPSCICRITSRNDCISAWQRVGEGGGEEKLRENLASNSGVSWETSFDKTDGCGYGGSEWHTHKYWLFVVVRTVIRSFLRIYWEYARFFTFLAIAHNVPYPNAFYHFYLCFS